MNERRRMPPEVRRQQILDTAVHLFFTMGYEGASLRDLAQHVGINKATVYHYFESKEEILFHILDDVGNALYGGLCDARNSSQDPMENLKAMVRFQICYMEDNLERIKVLVEEQKSLGPESAAKSKIIQSDILRLYEEVLTQCMDGGQVRKMHLASVAFSIIGQINWIYYWYKPGGSLEISALADQVLSIVLHGIASE